MTKISLTSDNFAKLIKQANLTLSADQQDKIRPQLDEALQAIGVLKELDTTKVKNTSSASGLTNVWREDIVQPSFPQELALSNSVHTRNGYFMVTAIFEPKDT
ncbi:MAG: Aspartyl/glutamyl-tRNA(Asn/Gln) amidotransferase subunit C [Microgenomates group bacterium GW2011_GWC2_46_7]|nr:MAG: Aspartyl/glutamyl-tRNA(Asn/Gln) amidotransferase subunit C [Microgenomates group bacterium GW2011_GWC2_46_7]